MKLKIKSIFLDHDLFL